MSAGRERTMFRPGLPRRLRPPRWATLVGLCLGLWACDPGPPLAQVDLNGRLLLGWRIDGAPLTQARCASEGLLYMEVDVVARQSGAQIGFTEVTCELDRYPLIGVPLGAVAVQVRGVGQNARKRACIKRVGTVTTQSAAQLGAEPVPVELASVACP